MIDNSWLEDAYIACKKCCVEPLLVKVASSLT